MSWGRSACCRATTRTGNSGTFLQGEEEAHILVQGEVRASHYSTPATGPGGHGLTKCPLMLVEASLARGSWWPC